MALLREVYGPGAEKVCPQPSLFSNRSAYLQTAAVPWYAERVNSASLCRALQIKVETRPWTIELPSRKLEVELTMISRCAYAAVLPFSPAI